MNTSQAMQAEDEIIALQALIDAFYPFVSVESIASAYCKAGNDPNKASEILCNLQKSTSDVDQLENENDADIKLEEDSSVEGNICSDKGSKFKKQSAAVGSVSSLLGNAYMRSTSSNKKEAIKSTKPLKVELPKCIQDIEPELDSVEANLKIKGLQEFLFSMLGDGFQLGEGTIHEVFGQCGYDMKKTMDKLLALSVKSLGKKHTGYPPDPNSISKEINKPSSYTDRISKEKPDLQTEVLHALFKAPDVLEEEPKKTQPERGLNRTRLVGRTVVKGPPDDISSRSPEDLLLIQPDFEHVEDENNAYRLLRKDAKEHWNKMRECYKQAVEAFSSGDRFKANELIEKGKYYNQMAREADERSAKEILDTRKFDITDDVPLDLHNQSPRDSVRLLKKHLLSLAKIPMFRYLKVTVNTDAEDTTKGKRKRLVIKLLERESVRWIEEDKNPGIILIPLDEIDKSKFTFLKDKEQNHTI